MISYKSRINLGWIWSKPIAFEVTDLQHKMTSSSKTRENSKRCKEEIPWGCCGGSEARADCTTFEGIRDRTFMKNLLSSFASTLQAGVAQCQSHELFAISSLSLQLI